MRRGDVLHHTSTPEAPVPDCQRGKPLAEGDHHVSTVWRGVTCPECLKRRPAFVEAGRVTGRISSRESNLDDGTFSARNALMALVLPHLPAAQRHELADALKSLLKVISAPTLSPAAARLIYHARLVCLANLGSEVDGGEALRKALAELVPALDWYESTEGVPSRTGPVPVEPVGSRIPVIHHRPETSLMCGVSDGDVYSDADLARVTCPTCLTIGALMTERDNLRNEVQRLNAYASSVEEKLDPSTPRRSPNLDALYEIGEMLKLGASSDPPYVAVPRGVREFIEKHTHVPRGATAESPSSPDLTDHDAAARWLDQNLSRLIRQGAFQTADINSLVEMIRRQVALDARIRKVVWGQPLCDIVCTRCGWSYLDTGKCSNTPCQGGVGEHPRQDEWHAARRRKP